MNLRSIVENKIAVRIFRPALFYAVSFSIIAILEEQSPGGPCVPGLGMLGFLLLIPVCVVLFLIDLYQAVEIDKAYLYSAGIHLLVWGLFIILDII
jgi:hypothetical protein